MAKYTFNKVITKIAKGTQQVHDGMRKAFVDVDLEKLQKAIEEVGGQEELQSILNLILYHQDNFIKSINEIQELKGSEIDLKPMFFPTLKEQRKNIYDQTGLNLAAKLLDDDTQNKELIALAASRGLASYLSFKEAAVDAFTKNLEMQKAIHTNAPNFYDMISITSKEKTDVYMLDTGAINKFLKSKFVDFIPEGTAIGAGQDRIVTGTINDFRLSLNSTARVDVVQKYFENEVKNAKSGVYQLDTNIAKQIFNNNDFKNYIKKSDYINNPSFGNKMESVMNALLQGDSLDYTNFFQTFDQPIKHPKTGIEYSYKFNIPASTFGGAQGDSVGGQIFKSIKDIKGEKVNTFTFKGYGSDGLKAETVNVQIKALNYQNKNTTRASWGTLSSIFQNTAMYASDSWFNRTKSSYREYLNKKWNSIEEGRKEEISNDIEDICTKVANGLAEALGIEDEAGKQALHQYVEELGIESENLQNSANESASEEYE